MWRAGYSAIEILAVVAIVLTLSVVVLPNLGNLDRGSKENVVVRNAALLNNAVQQYDQLGGADRRPLLTAQVPVPPGVEGIRDPNLLPEMKVLSLLENQDGTSFITRSRPTFADEGYRLVWVNNYEDPVQPVVGRNVEAEKLAAAGQGGRFELIGPDSGSNRLGITGFTESSTGFTASNTAVAVSMTPTPRPTPAPSPIAIDASGNKVTTGESSSPTPTPRVITPRQVSPTPSGPVAPPTPVALGSVSIAVEPWVGTRLSTFTFRAKGSAPFAPAYSPDGSPLLYSFTLPDGTRTPYSPESNYSWSDIGQPAGIKNVSVTVRNSLGQWSSESMNFMLENIRPGVTAAFAPARAALDQEATIYIVGYDDVDRRGGAGSVERSLQFRMKWDDGPWGSYTDADKLGRMISYAVLDDTHPLNAKICGVSEMSFKKSFNTVGTKKLTVQAIDSDGALSDEFSATLTVTDNLPPSVRFVDPPSSGKAGQAFEFVAAADDPEGESVEYSFRVVETYQLDSLKGLDAVTTELAQRGRPQLLGLNDWTSFSDVGLAVFTHPGNFGRSGASDSFTLEVRARDSSGMISQTARHTVTIANIPPRVWARASKFKVTRGEEVDFSVLVMDENYSLPLPPSNPVPMVSLKPVNLNLMDQILSMHTGGWDPAAYPRSILQVRWQYTPESEEGGNAVTDVTPWETVGTLGGPRASIYFEGRLVEAAAPTLRRNFRRALDMPGSYTLDARIVIGQYLEWNGEYNWRLEREAPKLPAATATVTVADSPTTVGFASAPATGQFNRPVVLTARGTDPQGGKLQYSFRLTNARNRDREKYPEAWEKTWMEFQDSPSAAFIPPGTVGGDLGSANYIVDVRARNASGQISEIAKHEITIENSPPRIWVRASKSRARQNENVEFSIMAIAANSNMRVSPVVPAGAIKLSLPPRYYGPQPEYEYMSPAFTSGDLEMRWVRYPSVGPGVQDDFPHIMADPDNHWQPLGDLSSISSTPIIMRRLQNSFSLPGKHSLQVRVANGPPVSATVEVVK